MGAILGVLFGLLLLFLVGQAFWKPLRIIIYLGARGVLGAVALLMVNLIAGLLNLCSLTIGVNVLSALAVGFLGLPGYLLLMALKLMMG